MLDQNGSLSDPLSHFADLNVGARFYVFVEDATVRGSELFVSGWAFHKDARIITGQLHILCGEKKHIFDMSIGSERADVWRASGESSLAMRSGFQGVALLPNMEFESVRVEFLADDGDRVGIDIHPQREKISIITFLERLRNAASKQRIRRAALCVLRGDFRYLWHQLCRFGSTNRVPPQKGALLDVALNTIATNTTSWTPIENRVDLVIPVYNGYEYLEPLFSSLKLNTSSPYRLIVIDDASPDPRIWPLLQTLVSSGSDAILQRNVENLGFVKTVNKAVQFTEGDFVLLNTDIEVPALWLERLMAPIGENRAIASATPFSNAATICSFPKMNADNELPSGIDAPKVDACFSMLDPNLPEVDAPTGVGFCMGINGDIWRQIGGFDDELFSRGYGEENDWCQRAISKGYRNVIVQNLFIYHKHGGSFESETRAALRDQNYRKLVGRWPSYPSEVDAFIKADPLAPARQMATLLAYCNKGNMPPSLIIDHDIGGGANTYRRKLVKDRLALNQPVFVLTAPQSFSATKSQLTLDFFFGEHHQRFESREHSSLRELFNVVRLGEIFFNNIVSYQDPLDIVRLILSLKSESDARLVLAVHDFYMMNPSYTLLNAEGYYPGIKEVEKSWLNINKNPFAYNPQNETIEEWHTVWGDLLEHADEILCFSDNSRDHLLKVYPECAQRALVRPHTLPVDFDRKPRLSNNKYLNIAVVGSIGQSKGGKIVAEISRVLAKEDKHARVTVVGILEGAPSSPNLRVTGPYKTENLPQILEDLEVNVCLLPSIWPETFSYVAEELMALDVPLVCFDLGAPAERVVHYQRGQIASEMSADGALRAIRGLLHRLGVF